MVDECPDYMFFNEDIQKCIYTSETFLVAWAEFIYKGWEEYLEPYGNELPWGNYLELPGNLPVSGISEEEYSRIVNSEFDDTQRSERWRLSNKVKEEWSEMGVNPYEEINEEYRSFITNLKEKIPRHIIDQCEIRDIKNDGRVLNATILTDGDRYMLLAFTEDNRIERGYIMLHRQQLHELLPFKGDDFFLKL